MLMMCGIRGGPKGCRIAKMLIKDFSCNVNARSPLTRETAVHVAAYHGKAGVLEVLLRDGSADPNLCDMGGWLPLATAAMNGHTEAVRTLCKYGACVYSATRDLEERQRKAVIKWRRQFTQKPRSPLKWAKEEGHWETLDVLAKKARSELRRLERDRIQTARQEARRAERLFQKKEEARLREAQKQAAKMMAREEMQKKRTEERRRLQAERDEEHRKTRDAKFGVWRRHACLRYNKEYRVASQSMDAAEHAMAARTIAEAAALLKDIANRATKNTLISDGDAGISREDFNKKKKKKKAKHESKSRRRSGKVAVDGGGADILTVHQ